MKTEIESSNTKPTTPFNAAQIAEASKEMQYCGSDTVARMNFGANGRFEARLCKTRFKEAWVFVYDTETPDKTVKTLNQIVWDGSLDQFMSLKLEKI